MKNACKHFALCTLTLILGLALASRGTQNTGPTAGYGTPHPVPATRPGNRKETDDSYE